MNTTVAFARKHFVEHSRRYLTALACLLGVAILISLLELYLFDVSWSVGEELIFVLVWVAIIWSSHISMRDWFRERYDTLYITLPVSATRRFFFSVTVSLIFSVVAPAVVYWIVHLAWLVFSGKDFLTIDAGVTLGVDAYLVFLVVHAMMIWALAWMKTGSRGSGPILLFFAAFLLFLFLSNLPEIQGWVDDYNYTVPNLSNSILLENDSLRLRLDNQPLGAFTHVAKVLSGFSMVLAIYISAWLKLKEREAYK